MPKGQISRREYDATTSPAIKKLDSRIAASKRTFDDPNAPTLAKEFHRPNIAVSAMQANAQHRRERKSLASKMDETLRETHAAIKARK